MNIADSLSDILCEIHLYREKRYEFISFAQIKELVVEYVKTTVSDPLLVIVHGTATMGKMTEYSDIDIMIVRKDFDAIRKRITQHRNYNLDVIETGIKHVGKLLDRARVTGENWIVSALAGGVIVLDEWEHTLTTKRAAIELLSNGPDTPSTQTINILRSSVTDLVSQLCRSQSADHIMITGLSLFPPLTSLLLKRHQSFSHRAKHLAEHLETVTPTMNNRLRNAYAKLLMNDPKELVFLARDILQPLGGWLMVGFENVTKLEPIGSKE